MLLENIKEFFLGDVAKRADYLFKLPHVSVIIATILLSIIISLVFLKKDRKTKMIFLWIAFALFLSLQIVEITCNLIKGRDLIKTLVPMHFSTIVLWYVIIMVPINKKSFYNIGAMMCLLSSVSYLVHPGVGFDVAKLNYTAFYSIITHSFDLVIAIFLLTNGFTEYKFKHFWHSFLFSVVIIFYSLLLNFVFYPGSNYLYYVVNPFSFDIGIWFQIIYFIILLIYISSFYFINYFITKAKEKRKLKTISF